MGERIHSGIAFLEPALKRPNLDVLIENQVTRLIQTGFGDTPSFMNVEFARSATCTFVAMFGWGFTKSTHSQAHCCHS